MLNTQVAIFSGPIKLIFVVKLINNQQNSYDPHGQKPTGNLTRMIEALMFTKFNIQEVKNKMCPKAKIRLFHSLELGCFDPKAGASALRLGWIRH